MSLEKLQEMVETLVGGYEWSLQLIKITSSKREGTAYTGRLIELEPNNALIDLIGEIVQSYSTGKKAITHQYESVTDYDGSTVNNTVYRLSVKDDLIADDYKNLLNAIANPDAEMNPLEFGANAYMICGKVEINGDEHLIKLFTMQRPITVLRHKYLMSNSKYKEISDNVLSLKTSVDVLVVDDTLYMLTLAGENLFNLERAYRATCSSKVEDIRKTDIVSDADIFESIATTGHNPRKFISFNDRHLEKLKNVRSRQKISKKFGIPLDSNNKFDMTQQDSAEKLVKVLCQRGMVDPFDDLPMEVAGSKQWVV